MLNPKHSQQFQINKLHFIGIGGVGMSGIAEILHNLGYHISGSDTQTNASTQHLAAMGCEIYPNHDANNLKTVHAVVISSAIDEDNVELVAAKNQGIPVVARAQMLAEIMRFRYGIAVSGTHGKTTTTSLISHIFAHANLDPTYIIGGVLNSSGVNAKLGSGDYLIAEADESDSSFLHLQPLLSIVTNIDQDHMATYDYDQDKLDCAFLNFIGNLPFYGTCVACIDDAGVRKIKSRINRPLLTYGFDSNADIQASNFIQNNGEMSYQVLLKKQQTTLNINATAIGKHNVLNMLGAIGAAVVIGIKPDIISQALTSFTGVGRRLERHKLSLNQQKITYFDDYGHHPNELSAVISGLKDNFNQRLVVVFQPHRYSRTRDLFDDFVQELSKVDVLILLDIYPANELPIRNINATTLAHAIRALNLVQPIVLKNTDDALLMLPKIIQKDDLLLTLGAGNIDKLAKALIQQYA